MAANPPGQSCSSCRYSGPREANDYGWVQCRRSPPILAGHSHDASQFPRTHLEYWCGEYAPERPQTVSEAATVVARLVLLGDAAAAHALIDRLQEDREASGG